jgi:di/tricarboxylate transporter
MNPAHLHILLTHAPFFATLFGIFLLLFGLVRKSEELKRIGLWVFALAAIITIPTYLTGTPANEFMKKLMPTMPLQHADQHEEIALIAMVAVIFLGVLALVGAVIFKKSQGLPNWFAGVLLAIALLSSSALAWAGNLGGKIRHTEIRQETPGALPQSHY